jgi:hypothetical protein
MLLFVCCTEGKDLFKFHVATESLPPELLPMELFYNLDSFFLRIRRPVPLESTAFVVTGDATDLRALLAMKDFLWNIRLILALPQEDPVALTLAHTLSPRFIAFRNGDFSDVAAVLKKMVGQQR